MAGHIGTGCCRRRPGSRWRRGRTGGGARVGRTGPCWRWSSLWGFERVPSGPWTLGAAPLAGLACGCAGLGAGFAFYALGWFGGGDGKLLAAMALWLGPTDVGFGLLAAAALLAVMCVAALSPGGRRSARPHSLSPARSHRPPLFCWRPAPSRRRLSGGPTAWPSANPRWCGDTGFAAHPETLTALFAGGSRSSPA